VALFIDGRPDAEPLAFDLKHRLFQVGFVISDFDPMNGFETDCFHFLADGVIALTGQAIDARSYHEMGLGLLRSAEQFVDIALTVSNVNAALRPIQKNR